MSSPLTLTINGVAVVVALRFNCGGRGCYGRTSLPNFSQRRTSRSSMRDGNLFRMSCRDQRKSALQELPDLVRIRNGSED